MLLTVLGNLGQQAHVLYSVTDLRVALQDHRPILCPAVLDMAAYASSGTFGMAPSLYDAVAFVRHQGQSPTCGHYTTITKHDGGSAWVEHSDAELNLCQQPFAASSQSLIAIYQRR